MEFFIVLLQVAYLLPLFSVFGVYTVAHSSLSKVGKVFSIIGIIAAVLIGSSLAGRFGYYPIFGIVNLATARGG